MVSGGIPALREWLRTTFRFRVPLMLYLAGAFLIPLTVGAIHFGLYLALGGNANFEVADPAYMYLGTLIGTTLLTGGNEEPGWRGFGLHGLLRQFSPFTATLILGVLHAGWHIPFFIIGYYESSFAWYLPEVVGLTFLFNWFYLNSKGSVIPVMLLHAGTNVISNFIPTPDDVIPGADDWIVLRFAIYWTIALVILIRTKWWIMPNLRREGTRN